jgi:cyclophilin family peptidyl-prolyl cis-trans isomerase
MKKYKIFLTFFFVINIFLISIISNNCYATNIAKNGISKNFYRYNIEDDRLTSGQNPYAIIETSMGTIKIELFKDLVPNTVDNFLDLSNISFYDGLVFHRVIDDFVIQGGGHYPNGTRKISPFGPIDLEINPKARHVDGAIGMARTSDPNSATSQFYICDGPQHFLDDNYAVFGKVTKGTMSVVRDIAEVETTTKYGMQDWPVEDIIINSVVIKEKTENVNTHIQNIMKDNLLFFSILKGYLQELNFFF